MEEKRKKYLKNVLYGKIGKEGNKHWGENKQERERKG